MKVLLPIADVDDSKLIVDFVANYHWPPKACFKLLHVLGSFETETARAEAESQARLMLDEIAGLLKDRFKLAEISTEVVSGRESYEIGSIRSGAFPKQSLRRHRARWRSYARRIISTVPTLRWPQDR